ncbi:MAG: N-acetyl-alpha-D-glucosaminyl L-malate synthase BshA [Chlamydiales bacterium]|jgi:N-acetyl-alpha-D-glucosaminyl L-malate synthase BshA
MDQKLKIGVVCHPTYGGSGVVASELALSLASNGHELHLFSYDVPPRLARSPGPVEVHVAQGIPYPLFAATPHDLAITSSILDVHRHTGLDIVHAHYAVPHAVSAFLAREAARSYPDRLPPRVVVTLHGTDITLIGNDPSYAPLTEHVLNASDAVTAVSESLAAATRDRFCINSTPCSIQVIPNFVDLERFSPDVEPDAKRGAHRPSAVHVSNFRPVKRTPWLVQAFELATRGTDAHLTLVGDGPDRARCQEIARELSICHRVKFLGLRDALPQLLVPATVYLLTSSEESFGLSALESLACGTPVVATRVGGVAEVVTDGVDGLLSDPDDMERFAANARALLTDPARAREMGLAGRRSAVERFDRRKVVRRYEDLYASVLDREPVCHD